MLYEILYPLSKHYTAFNLFRYISFRAIFAALTAFLVCVIVGPAIIRMLLRLKVGEKVWSADPTILAMNRKRENTPTMGGFIMLLAIVIAVFLFGRLDNLYVILGLWTVAAYALIGAADDWRKQKTRRGLRTLTKLWLQVIVTALAVTVMWLELKDRPGLTSFQMPFLKDWVIELGPAYVVLGFVVIVGASNGVNFTDGMDGLAIGGVTMTALTLMVIAYLVGRVDTSRFLHLIYVPGAGELTVFLGAIVGAGLGFLWFNCPPAEIFMGDTGSLSLGAALGFVAFACRQEVALAIAGLMFVADALSVLIQVGSFRIFGRKWLPFAPLSNLWKVRGMEPTKITVRYWIVTALMGALALALLKVR
ncbi:MAG: phospho-N-acetylmuramoyl-pentapeptide-transferase [Planctomycetes bacterium]|nr:phospho-N-acetylmuramoyl-pentapeptide-transferase [Planctomycetota bacterium]